MREGKPAVTYTLIGLCVAVYALQWTGVLVVAAVLLALAWFGWRNVLQDVVQRYASV